MKRLLKQSGFAVGLVKAFRQLGPDLRRFNLYLRRGRSIKKYCQSHPVRKLQIGSGRNLLPGWLNTDLMPRSAEQVYLDATKPYPFHSETFDCIFSEHVIEHLPFDKGLVMLRECHRVLKSGGRIRISTPNLQRIASLLSPEKTEAQSNYIRLACDKYIPGHRNYQAAFVINNFFWGFGHYFVYDPETLAAALQEAGFRNVTPCEPGQSDDPNFKGVESHGRVVGDEINWFESMVFEAVRP